MNDLSLLKCKLTNEIPSLPFENYDDLMESIKEQQYLLLLDNSKANDRRLCFQKPQAQ